jgi:toxin HigB-1
MIVDFYCPETEKIFNGEVSTKFPPDIQNVARRKLRMIAAAININDLRQPPGNRLEKLSGDREGQYSIRVNDQWRICFVWDSGNAYRVEMTDYH